MSEPDNVISDLAIRRSLRVQSVVSLVLAGGLLLVGQVAAYSSLFGSIAVYLPSLIFALLVIPRVGSDSVTFLRTAVVAEVAKIVLMAMICVAVLVWVKPLAPGWFFGGMIVALFSSRVAMVIKP